MNTSVCLITRGVAPARCVINAYRSAYELSLPFSLIEGLPAVDAKNKAVELADATGNHLLLLEDDVIASPWLWNQVANHTGNPDSADVVAYGSAIDRSGTINIYRSPSGKLLWTGTVFIWIARQVLDRLPRPLFVPMDYTYTKEREDLLPIGQNKAGHHSDVHVWQLIRNLEPAADIVHMGKVDHFEHRLNQSHDLQNPIPLTAR